MSFFNSLKIEDILIHNQGVGAKPDWVVCVVSKISKEGKNTKNIHAKHLKVENETVVESELYYPQLFKQDWRRPTTQDFDAIRAYLDERAMYNRQALAGYVGYRF